jgi:hypothetical protein
MTLVEFLAPLKGASHRERVLAVLYYRQRYDGMDALTVEQITEGLERARAPKWRSANVADVLAKSGAYVDAPGRAGRALLWKLTPSGADHVRDRLGLPATDPEAEHDIGTLTTLASKVKDTDVRAYVEEAITCLQVDALRACVVFLWVGAIRTIHTEMLTYPESLLNAALAKHDPKARKVTKLDHFAYINDVTALLAAQELSMYDKSEKDTLVEALNLRNRCGHPAKYKPGVKKVSSFIEDIISTVY